MITGRERGETPVVSARSDRGPVVGELSAFADDEGDALFLHSGLLALAVIGDGRIRRATPGFLRLFGLSAAASPRALDRLAERLLRALVPEAGGEPAACAHCVLRLADGRRRTVELHAAAGHAGVLGVTAHDVSERAEDYQRLRHLAMHDVLTGLPNRALMREHLEQAVATDQRHGRGCAALLVDLDGFKAVNDDLGHAAGDALLEAVATRLKACCRASDSVTRYGGDEFVVVASPIGSPEEAAMLAARIVSELGREYVLDDAVVRVGASVGVAVRSEAREDAGLLLSEADAAMYLAKGEGKNRYALARVDQDTVVAMPDLEWPAERAVGIAQVDEEHAALASEMNALLGRARAGDDSQRLARGLHDLMTSLARHFATEERHMRAHPADQDADHREEHRRIMDDLQRLTAVVSERNVALTIRYLHQWLYRHVDGYDRHLGHTVTHDAGDDAAAVPQAGPAAGGRRRAPRARGDAQAPEPD